MSEATVVVQGVVKPDGSLELVGKVPLPAGKVHVTVQSVRDLPEGDPFFDRLKDIRAARAKAGLTPRTEAEVKAVRQQLNDEMDDEIAAAMRLQEECRAARKRADALERDAE
ncbi:MAG TPA: hypothetical protein DDY78_02305 [Planctomycetales bacterium]|jgi:hypothetical protein|nr:hypothetical protein [Planctomycetales bacterium]